MILYAVGCRAAALIAPWQSWYTLNKYTETSAEGHPPWYGSWASPGAKQPIIDRDTLMVVYTPQIEEAKDFFRQLRWVLEQKQVADQDVVLIEHTTVWLVEPSPLRGETGIS